MRVGAALALLAGCTSVFGLDSPQRAPRDGAVVPDVVDSTMLDAAPDAPPFGPWANVQQAIVSAESDDDPSATGDRLELYFNRSEAIFRSLRATTADPWGTATLVTELSSGLDDSSAEVSADGLMMLLSSGRAPSGGTADIWSSKRTSRSSPWEAPIRLDKINSGARDLAGSLTTNRLEIVYAADRTTTNEFDLYYSARSSDTEFERGTKLPFSTTNNETSPFLTGDGQTLYMAIIAAFVQAEIYVSQRLGPNDWSTPVLVSELSTSVAESDPWVSPDGRHMIFARVVAGKFQIFEASR